MASKSRLARLIDRYTEGHGHRQTPIDGLTLIRFEEPLKRTPVIYDPSILVVAQGAKHAHLDDRTYVYDVDNYLICSITLPVESEIPDASSETPYLGIKLSIDSTLVGKILLEMDEHVDWPNEPLEPSIRSGPIDADMARTFERLVDLVDRPMDRAILAPGLLREAIYAILKGPIGHVLRDCVVREGSANRIAKVVRFLEENCTRALDVDLIASHANMSTSALHHHFKQVTRMTPMQYVKRLRLHRARVLLLSGHSAGDAAYAVGYASPSQFSREFRRLFGLPPNQARAAVNA